VGTFKFSALGPRPDDREISRTIKKTMKDYRRTMKKLA
jgi:hypothetical protein